LLFDVFEFVFSPVVFAGLGAAVFLALLWAARDSSLENASSGEGSVQMRTAPPPQPQPVRQEANPRVPPPPSSPDSIYLGMRLRVAKQKAQDEEATGSRFVLRFSSENDLVYENPVRGGSFQLQAGTAYVEEFSNLAGAKSLALQLYNKNVDVEFQIFEVKGQDWLPRFASSWGISYVCVSLYLCISLSLSFSLSLSLSVLCMCVYCVCVCVCMCIYVVLFIYIYICPLEVSDMYMHVCVCVCVCVCVGMWLCV
jgi:hypothetical protein